MLIMSKLEQNGYSSFWNETPIVTVDIKLHYFNSLHTKV